MTRIDFYVLQPGAQGNRFTLAARLAEKAWRAGHRILIATPTAEEQRHMDRLLWTYREQSFIPHGILGNSDPALNPILIGSSADAGNEHDVLINLCAEIPEYFSSFERVAECVDHEQKIIDISREHYRYYRHYGYSLHHHAIS